MSKTHELKTEEPYFTEMWQRKKLAELRFDDRGYQCGDTIEFRQWDKEKGYGNKIITARIASITRYAFALQEGWVMLSLCDYINSYRVPERLTNTEILMYVLGWQGGTIHQLAHEIGINQEDILEADAEKMRELVRVVQKVRNERGRCV